MKKRLRLGLLIMLMLFLLCGCAGENKTEKYGDARNLFDEGRYEEAQALFTEVSDYENSAKYIAYISAAGLCDSGDFEGAANAFSALGGFLDSKESYIYCGARLLEGNGDFDGAYSAYASIPDFKDSLARIDSLASEKEARRFDNIKALFDAGSVSEAAAELDSVIAETGADKALTAAKEAASAGNSEYSEWLLGILADKNIEGALDELTALRVSRISALIEENTIDSIGKAKEILLLMGDSQETQALTNECNYRLALIARGEGRNSEAAEMLSKLGGYKDSAELLKEYTDEYSAAQALLEQQDYDGAKARFLSLGDYSMSAEMVKECDYRRALSLFSEGKVQEAVECFGSLQGYKDSAEYVSGAYDKLAANYAEKGDVLAGAEVYRSAGRNADADAFIFSNAEALASAGNAAAASALYLAIPDYEGSLERNFELGKQKLQSGDYTAAERILSPAIDYSDTRECIYQKAQECLEANDFDGAKALFALDSGYKDSDDKLNETAYKQAAKLVADGEFDAAAEIYSSLDGYLDSAEYAQDALYRKAKSLVEKGDYSRAQSVLSGIASYSGAEELMNECDYKLADKLLSADNFSEAKDAFLELGDYSDSAEKVKECEYRFAEALYSEGSINEARERFLALGYYSDSAARVSDCDFKSAMLLYDAGDYAGAKDAFSAIGGNSESENMVKECSYKLAEMALESGDSISAYEAFAALADYRDSASRAQSCAAENAKAAVSALSLADAEDWLIKAGSAEGAEETTLALADRYLESGDIDKALQICSVFGTSESAKAKIYAIAAECENSGDSDKARYAYGLAGDYLDAKTKSDAYYEEVYLAASSEFDAGNFASAAEKFGVIAGYKDSAEKAELANKEASYSVGGVITMGAYEQDNDKANGAEPITWIILKRDGENAMLMSEYLLERLKYNNGYVKMTWAKCSLRAWLNDDFYKDAFSAEERSAILVTKVENPMNPSFSIKGGSYTNDKLFCLNIQEIDELLTTDDARRAKATPYAIANGANADEDSYAPWWLRSPGYTERYAARILMDGSVEREGYIVNFTTTSVRPVMWVNLTLLRQIGE